MLSIKVLGPGCANCVKVARSPNRRSAVSEVEAQIEKVIEFPEIKKYQILADWAGYQREVVCAGRIPTKAEVTTWLTNALT